MSEAARPGLEVQHAEFFRTLARAAGRLLDRCSMSASHPWRTVEQGKLWSRGNNSARGTCYPGATDCGGESMSDLINERCVACRRDAPRVTDEEIAALKPLIP